jgi:hypothetical protein
MGCLRKLGFLVLLVLLAAVAWVYQDRWRPLLHGGRAVAPIAAAPDTGARDIWEPLTAQGAARARALVRTLGSRRGPVFANVRAGDLSAYVFEELSKQLPPSAQNPEAAVIDDALHVRADMRPSDFGGTQALGPFAAMLGDREPVEFGGTLEIVRPGLAQYHVRMLRIHQLSIPRAMIPKLIANIARGARPSGIAADALPLVVPEFIGDVRIHDGKITLYKATP